MNLPSLAPPSNRPVETVDQLWAETTARGQPSPKKKVVREAVLRAAFGRSCLRIIELLDLLAAWDFSCDRPIEPAEEESDCWCRPAPPLDGTPWSPKRGRTIATEARNRRVENTAPSPWRMIRDTRSSSGPTTAPRLQGEEGRDSTRPVPAALNSTMAPSTTNTRKGTTMGTRTTETETADTRTMGPKADNTTTTTRGRPARTTLRRIVTALGRTGLDRVAAVPRPAAGGVPCQDRWEETGEEVHILPAVVVLIRARGAAAPVVAVGLTP